MAARRESMESTGIEPVTYCSPAGAGVGIDGIVLLPFAWRNVDAYHLLPQFGALRRHVDGSSEPSRPEHERRPARFMGR